MSSTNRGYNRHHSDYYITPIKPIVDFLRNFSPNANLNWQEANFYDPCAGGSERDLMSYPEALQIFGIYAETSDIREDSRANHKFDYLETDIKKIGLHTPDVIISNPPFNLALPFITKALKDVSEGGYVIMLLRLNFLGSGQRLPFFRGNMPKFIYVHSKRINFIPDWLNKEIVKSGGKKLTGDSIEYAHFVWQKGFKGETILKLI